MSETSDGASDAPKPTVVNFREKVVERRTGVIADTIEYCRDLLDSLAIETAAGEYLTALEQGDSEVRTVRQKIIESVSELRRDEVRAVLTEVDRRWLSR